MLSCIDFLFASWSSTAFHDMFALEWWKHYVGDNNVKTEEEFMALRASFLKGTIRKRWKSNINWHSRKFSLATCVTFGKSDEIKQIILRICRHITTLTCGLSYVLGLLLIVEAGVLHLVLFASLWHICQTSTEFPKNSIDPVILCWIRIYNKVKVDMEMNGNGINA